MHAYTTQMTMIHFDSGKEKAIIFFKYHLFLIHGSGGCYVVVAVLAVLYQEVLGCSSPKLRH